jgi:hypothetical protein
MILHGIPEIGAQGQDFHTHMQNDWGYPAKTGRLRSCSAMRSPGQPRVCPSSSSITPIPVAPRPCRGGSAFPPFVPRQPRPFWARNPTHATRSHMRALLGRRRTHRSAATETLNLATRGGGRKSPPRAHRDHDRNNAQGERQWGGPSRGVAPGGPGDEPRDDLPSLASEIAETPPDFLPNSMARGSA